MSYVLPSWDSSKTHKYLWLSSSVKVQTCWTRSQIACLSGLCLHERIVFDSRRCLYRDGFPPSREVKKPPPSPWKCLIDRWAIGNSCWSGLSQYPLRGCWYLILLQLASEKKYSDRASIEFKKTDAMCCFGVATKVPWCIGVEAWFFQEMT